MSESTKTRVTRSKPIDRAADVAARRKIAATLDLKAWKKALPTVAIATAKQWETPN